MPVPAADPSGVGLAERRQACRSSWNAMRARGRGRRDRDATSFTQAPGADRDREAVVGGGHVGVAGRVGALVEHGGDRRVLADGEDLVAQG